MFDITEVHRSLSSSIDLLFLLSAAAFYLYLLILIYQQKPLKHPSLSSTGPFCFTLDKGDLYISSRTT